MFVHIGAFFLRKRCLADPIESESVNYVALLSLSSDGIILSKVLLSSKLSQEMVFYGAR